MYLYNVFTHKNYIQAIFTVINKAFMAKPENFLGRVALFQHIKYSEKVI